jgi:hypothetical protein
MVGDHKISENKESGQLLHDRFVFNRKLLLFCHIIMGCFAAFLYLSRVDFSSFQYWRPRASLGVVFIAAPPLIPYVISGVRSWQLVSHCRMRVWLFIAVLVAGTILMGLLFGGAFEEKLDGGMLLGAIAIQSCIYFWAAEHLLEVD